jgi:hypothetical protein
VTAGEINEVPDYIGLLSEMCDDFDLFQRSKKFALNPRVPAHLTLIYGLNCHAHYMVRRCLPLLAESTIVAVTIVRSVFECGVMAQWLRWFPGSEDSLLEESHRQMTALTKDLSRSATPHYREGAARLSTHPALTEWPDPSEEAPAHAAKFAAICRAFYTGAEVYIDYRFLSGCTHAGTMLAAAWLDPDRTRPRIRHTPQEPFTVERLGRVALLALGWSSRAFDDLAYKSPRSDFLNSVEQRTGLDLWLQPKPTPTRGTTPVRVTGSLAALATALRHPVNPRDVL